MSARRVLAWTCGEGHAMSSHVKIVTSYRIRGSDFWSKRVDAIDYNPVSRRLRNPSLKAFVKVFDDLVFLLIYLRIMLQKRYDVLVTYRDSASNLFAMVQGVFGRRIPFVMLNLLWRIPEGRFARLIRKINLKILIRGVSRIAVFASHEIDGYYKHFQLPREKFVYIPYYFTPAATSPDIEEGDYIFSGGHAAYRDYWTLINAVRDSGIPCRIATQAPEYFKGKDIPAHVQIFRLPEEEYFQCMAQCKMVVIPLLGDHFRSTGQRTYLNAMLMGKPVIVCDTEGIKDYMENNVDGIILPPADTEALKAAIRWVMDHPVEARAMGERAREKAKTFTIDRTMKHIVDLCEQEARKVKS